MKLPLQNAGDVINAIKCIGLGNLYMARYINYTVSDVLKKYGLEKDRELIALLSMLVEDTVNSTLNEAPVINAALGITIRGTGLRRAAGGMNGFWRHLINRYKMLGGVLLVGQRVGQFYREGEGYRLITRKGTYTAKQVLSAIPAENTINIAPENVGCILNRYVQRDKARYEGAIVMFLGVPDIEVACQSLTHHQIFYHHDLPLGNGNNMFISVSTQGDEKSAPRGFRPVMISTHCNCLNGKAFRPKNIC